MSKKSKPSKPRKVTRRAAPLAGMLTELRNLGRDPHDPWLLAALADLLMHDWYGVVLPSKRRMGKAIIERANALAADWPKLCDDSGCGILMPLAIRSDKRTWYPPDWRRSRDLNEPAPN